MRILSAFVLSCLPGLAQCVNGVTAGSNPSVTAICGVVYSPGNLVDIYYPTGNVDTDRVIDFHSSGADRTGCFTKAGSPVYPAMPVQIAQRGHAVYCPDFPANMPGWAQAGMCLLAQLGTNHNTPSWPGSAWDIKVHGTSAGGTLAEVVAGATQSTWTPSCPVASTAYQITRVGSLSGSVNLFNEAASPWMGGDTATWGSYYVHMAGAAASIDTFLTCSSLTTCVAADPSYYTNPLNWFSPAYPPFFYQCGATDSVPLDLSGDEITARYAMFTTIPGFFRYFVQPGYGHRGDMGLGTSSLVLQRAIRFFEGRADNGASSAMPGM